MGLSEIAAHVDAEKAKPKLSPAERAAFYGKIGELVERSGLDVDEIARIDKVRVGAYQGLTKDADGEVHIHDMESSGIVLTPKWADGPEWPVVQPADPVIIKPAPRPKKPKKGTPALVRKWKTATVLPDPQIGYRALEGGEMDPFHDAAAIDVALQVIAAVQHESGVDLNLNLGDFLDLPSLSRFAQEAAFAGTMQAAINWGHQFLARQRATAPDAHQVLIEGNHDRRMQNFVQANALAAFGIKRANMPKSWPVMSLPHLLRLDELDFEYIDAWPTGAYWINDKLRAMHGDKVRSGGSTAHAMVKANPNIGTIHGHIHRLESHSTTIFERVGGKTRPLRSGAYSPGCLCMPLSTEILTITGWKKHHELNEGDFVLGYRDGQMAWGQVTGKVLYQDAEVVRVSHPQFSAVCTPDHRWVTQGRRGGRNTRHLSTEVKHLTELRGEDSLVLSAPYAGGHGLVKPDEAAILAWILTDGTIEWNAKAGARATIYQSPKKYATQIEDLLTRYGADYSIYDDSRGLRHFRLRAGTVRALWSSLGLPNGRPTKEALVPLILSFSVEALDAFYEAAFLAEGNTGPSAARNHDVIAQQDGDTQEALALAMFLKGNHVRRWKTSHDHIAKLVAGTPTVSGQKGRIAVTPAGREAVWCPETTLDTWVARQGHEVFLTGNCRIDGAVPSMKGSTGLDGRPAEFFEDWQQGMAIVRYTDEGDYFVNVHQIIDGMTVVGGQTFEATVDVYDRPLELDAA